MLGNMRRIIVLCIGLSLQGCCLSYQPETIDKIVQPFSNEIKDFYSKNNKYPDNNELKTILSRIKWKEINLGNDYDCNGHQCHISTLYSDKKSVEIQVTYDNTTCNYYFKNKTMEKKCFREPCFLFKQ